MSWTSCGGSVGRKGDQVSEEAARKLWKRAADLQSRAEEESTRPAAVSALQDPDALPVSRVVEAAQEAGIAREHALQAVAEGRLVDAEELDPDRWTGRWLARLVGGGGAVEVTRFVDAPIARVVEAVESVTSTEAFRLELEDRLGESAEGEALLVYRNVGSASWLAFSSFHGSVDIADGRALIVVLVGEAGGTRLRVRMPLYRRGLNLLVAGGAAGTGATGGTAGGAAVGGAVAGALGMATLAGAVAVGALGAVAGIGAGLWAFRGLYGWGVRSGETALERLVRAIVLEAERDADSPEG